MRQIRIKTMGNGYLASEDVSRDNPLGYDITPYVFESFGNLIEWLRTNLDLPDNQKIDEK